MAPIFQKAGVPLMAGPSIATQITSQFINEKPSQIFRCSMVEKFQIDGMLDWGVKKFGKIGLIHSTTGYGNFAAKEIQDTLKAKGVTLVVVEAAAPGVTDLTPQMVKMRDSGAELVLELPRVLELVYRPWRRLNYRPVVAGNLGPVLAEGAGDRRQGGDRGHRDGPCLDISTPRAKSFDERMKREYACRLPLAGAGRAGLRRRADRVQGGREGRQVRSDRDPGSARIHRRRAGDLRAAAKPFEPHRSRMPGP
jgi:branched-chain amino acid transport system substrate-binding protein